MNWFKTLFTRQPKERYTRPGIIHKMLNAYFEQRAMRGYIWSQGSCEARSHLPSKKLMRAYGLSYDTNNLEVWGIIEKYVNGELVEKPKVEVRVTEIQKSNRRVN